MLNFLRLAAQQGVLVKEARALELLPQIDTVVFDKTGTLTLEQPRVVQVHLCGELTAVELLHCAAAAESRQSHPIARAIVEAAQERGLALPSIAEARYEVGYGIMV
jgi:Cu2+-exporting ATPase